MRKYEIDFKALRARIPIEQGLAYLQINKLKREGKELRGDCPICGSDERAFSVTPSKGTFTCYGKCKNHGDIIQLTACVVKVGVREAAKILHDHFDKHTHNSDSPPAPAPAKAANGIDLEKYASALDPAHAKLEPLGISPEVFKAWRAGVPHGSGVLAGMLALPVTRDGKIVAYVGRSIGEEEVRIKFPKTEFGGKDFCAEDFIFGEDRVTEKALVLVSDPLDVVTHKDDGTSFICFLREKLDGAITLTSKQLRKLNELIEASECETLVLLV